MTRRMQANDEYRNLNPTGPYAERHYVEHDENNACEADPACEPVTVPDTVAVPRTGHHLVINGRVISYRNLAEAMQGMVHDAFEKEKP